MPEDVAKVTRIHYAKANIILEVTQKDSKKVLYLVRAKGEDYSNRKVIGENIYKQIESDDLHQLMCIDYEGNLVQINRKGVISNMNHLIDDSKAVRLSIL
jgi:hypothetical protein